MKVYIVFCYIDYEGSDIHSIYTTREAAETVKDALNAERYQRGKTHSCCDNHTVGEHEVKNGTN
jgi:hypothetical protein